MTKLARRCRTIARGAAEERAGARRISHGRTVSEVVALGPPDLDRSTSPFPLFLYAYVDQVTLTVGKTCGLAEPLSSIFLIFIVSFVNAPNSIDKNSCGRTALPILPLHPNRTKLRYPLPDYLDRPCKASL